MKRWIRNAVIAAVLTAAAGCHYRLTDADTGAVYYVRDADSRWSLMPGESVRFTDARSGETMTLHYPKIETITRSEFDAAVSSPSP